MADKKVSQLDSLTTTAAPDLLMIVDDPNGTPVSKKITVKNFFGAVPSITSITGHVTPSANVTYDLGSAAKAWRSLYISNNSIHIGNKVLTVADNGTVLVDGVNIVTQTEIPTPAIEFTGTFGDLPEFWRYNSSNPVLQYSSNGAFRSSGGNLYWLDQNFDDGDYDLSGLTTIRFTNIGGILGYLDFTSKSEVALTSLNLGEIQVIDEWVGFAGFSNTLTTFSASNLVDIGGNFEIYGNQSVNGIRWTFPALDRVTNTFYIDYNSNNSDYFRNTPAPSFPALSYVGSGMYMYYNRYTSWSNFPSLTKVQGDLQFRNNTNNDDALFAGPGFPTLQRVQYGSLRYYQNDGMQSVPAFTALTRIDGEMQFYQNYQLEAFPSFPVLTYVAGVNSSDCTSMTTLAGANTAGGWLPSLLYMDGDVNFRNCALDETSVDKILIKLASLDGTANTTSYNNRYVYVDQGTNAIPSANGAAAVATLEGRGCVVAVNS